MDLRSAGRDAGRPAMSDAGRPTMNDVARSAGVSLKTVSQVVNGETDLADMVYPPVTGPATTEVLPTRPIARGSGEAAA